MPAVPLRPSKAPNLIVARPTYDMQQQELFKNQLRLYFNEIDNFSAAILSGTGGAGLSLPFIAASDSTDQLATAANTPTIVKWNTLDSGNGFTLNAPGTATAQASGVYKITYSLQLTNTDNAAHDAAVWLKIDTGSGFVDVPNSTTIFTVPARKSAGVFSYLCAYSEVVFSLEVGDSMGLYWATNQAYATSPATDGIYIEHLPAQTVPYARPAVPSALGSITFVSRTPT
jgi:hypothetical protein